MDVPFLDLGRLHRSIETELTEAITGVIGSSSFIEGPEVAAFESEFAVASRLAAVAGCSSGTDALSLALRALGVGPGDEVVVPSMTYIATAEAVLHVGATPVLADVDPETLLITEANVQEVMSSRTRAVVPVHLFGHTVDFASIASWREQGLVVLEDCAQAHLATQGGRPVGSVGDAAAFSFFPGKNLGALGDAGAVATEDVGLATEVRRLRNHGRREKYLHEVLGYAARLDSLQAAVLSVKLRHLAGWTAARRDIADQYRRLLPPSDGARLVPFDEGAVHHLLVVRSGSRDDLREWLSQRGVATGIHYPVALSRQPALEPFARATPNAEAAAREVLSLPMDPLMSVEEVEYVCEQVRAFAGVSA